MNDSDDSYDSLFTETPYNYIEERNHLLKDVSFQVVRKAWFTLSHLLIDEGSKVVDMGCSDGELTYAMAALNPKVKFIGVDKGKKNISKAREKYKIHNLEYKHGDVSSDLFPPESVDVIINSYILHHIFSNARYNQRIVSDTLRKHFHMLKNGGLMFLRDYARPQQDHFVLMEMHDEESHGEDLASLSEADLLVWYSEHARPKQDPGCGGFFLEELPPRFPRTRLFRLPFKWAYEFIMRKDNRSNWARDLPYEYTYFTVSEFRQELQNLGARVEYSGPHWDETFIQQNFDGHFRLYENDGTTMGDPPTSFIAVSRKLPERESLNIKERRISHDETGPLEIKALRNEKTGELVDVVSRKLEIAEILPYRITEDGRLYIYLHSGIVRGLVNAVPRSGINIDGRQWSGHMVEPVALDYTTINEMGEIDKVKTKKFAQEFLGLVPDKDSLLVRGADYYPDPNYIDERVHSFYLPVKQAKGITVPKNGILQGGHFKAKGNIKEFSAQTVLDAISVGLIPNARLELQILALFQHLNLKAENWVSKDLSLQAGEITTDFKIRDFLRQVSNNDQRFKEVKGTAGQLRTVSSFFVEEGQSHGGRTGLTSDLVDFVISDEKTINTAVVLPLTLSTKGDVHAGFLVKHMPVPQRYIGNGLSVSVPQFNIPKDITNYKLLKQFIAEKFGVTPDMVLKLGESYFSHIGITPERIHPFAIAAPPSFFKDPRTKFIPIYQYMLLWRSISREPHFMTVIARSFRFLPAHMKTQAKLDVKAIIEKRFKQAQPEWTMPASFQPNIPQSFKKAGAFPDGGGDSGSSGGGGGKPDPSGTSGASGSKGTREELEKELKAAADPSSTEKPKDFSKRKEKEKKEKKERAKRYSIKKLQEQNEPEEASFDAEENEKALEVDLTKDNPLTERVGVELDPVDTDPEILHEDEPKDADFDPNDYELDDQDLDEPDSEGINLIEEFEREIREIREALARDEENKPKPEKW